MMFSMAYHSAKTRLSRQFSFSPLSLLISGVTRLGVVLNELQSLLDCQKNFFLSLSDYFPLLHYVHSFLHLLSLLGFPSPLPPFPLSGRSPAPLGRGVSFLGNPRTRAPSLLARSLSSLDCLPSNPVPSWQSTQSQH